MAATATVFQFPTDLQVITTGVKLTKDGRVKKTHSNAKKGRSTAQDPFRNVEDISKLIAYCDDQMGLAKRGNDRMTWARNKMYIGIGIFSGFRFSDLVTLRFEDIFKEDGSYREYISVVEQKTGKVKELVLTEMSRQYIDEYITKVNPVKVGNLFLNKDGNPIGRDGVDRWIKKATKECGIDGSYSTHSIRKTYAYHFYMTMANEMGDTFALAETQALLNHRNSQTTLRYLGITQQRVAEKTQAFAEYMKENWMV